MLTKSQFFPEQIQKLFSLNCYILTKFSNLNIEMNSSPKPKKLENIFERFPEEVEELYSFLEKTTKEINTFDLLAFSSYYNHIHDMTKYSDFREDRNFFVPEILSLLTLKNEYVTETSITEEDFFDLMEKLQSGIIEYSTKSDFIEWKNHSLHDNLLEDLSNKLSREAKKIRNPGLPDHHFIFSEKLFEPLEKELREMLGFSILESIKIRKSITQLIQEKTSAAVLETHKTAQKYAREIQKNKKKKKTAVNFPLDENLEDLLSLSYQDLLNLFSLKLKAKLLFSLGKTYSFSAIELCAVSEVNFEVVNSFLENFSIGFPSLKKEDPINNPVSILRTKPLLKHNNRYLLPSIPLLTWTVEEVIEERKSQVKWSNKYSQRKHNFLLDHGLEIFSNLFPTASLLKPNLYYTYRGERCETDGLILYDRILFIIEAKGNRISSKARAGHRLKTQDHLKDLIRNSYSQGLRTLDYLEERDKALFQTEEKEEIILTRADFDKVIITSLTLEPIGNLSVLIKTTNELGFFKENHFPWIISLYDLILFKDFLPNPFLLILFLQERRKFLDHEKISIYEEADLFAYFLKNRFFMEDLLSQINRNDSAYTQLWPATDQINDYYMYKFGHKSIFTKKPSLPISVVFHKFLLALDKAEFPNRIKMALLILKFNKKSIDHLMKQVLKRKAEHIRDKKLHDCSIANDQEMGMGVTYMIGADKEQLRNKLSLYCQYKQHQLNINTWIGLGDISNSKDHFDFQVIYFNPGPIYEPNITLK